MTTFFYQWLRYVTVMILWTDVNKITNSVLVSQSTSVIILKYSDNNKKSYRRGIELAIIVNYHECLTICISNTHYYSSVRY